MNNIIISMAGPRGGDGETAQFEKYAYRKD